MYLTTLSAFGQPLMPEYIPEIGAPARGRVGLKTEEIGREDLDEIYRRNHFLRQRVEDAARIVGIDPGFLAANLFAENSKASVWSRTSGTVASEILGLDDWFDPVLSKYIGRVIRNRPGTNLRQTEVKKTGSLWDVSTEKAGTARSRKPRGRLPAAKAVIAIAVLIKAQENLLRQILVNKGFGDALKYLTPEVRFTVLRVAFNAGVGTAWQLSLLRGSDIPRAGSTQRNQDDAVRSAVLHMARGVHLSQAVFGRPPTDYMPMPTPKTTQDIQYRLQRQDRAGMPKMSPPPR